MVGMGAIRVDGELHSHPWADPPTDQQELGGRPQAGQAHVEQRPLPLVLGVTNDLRPAWSASGHSMGKLSIMWHV